MDYKVDRERKKKTFNIAQYAAGAQKHGEHHGKIFVENLKKDLPSCSSAFEGQGNKVSDESQANANSVRLMYTERREIIVDPNQPVTKLRIRLCDGSQKIQDFNESHTVADLVTFCGQWANGDDFELRNGFPPTPIDTSRTATLKEANILNDTIIQRLL